MNKISLVKFAGGGKGKRAGNSSVLWLSGSDSAQQSYDCGFKNLKGARNLRSCQNKYLTFGLGRPSGLLTKKINSMTTISFLSIYLRMSIYNSTMVS